MLRVPDRDRIQRREIDCETLSLEQAQIYFERLVSLYNDLCADTLQILSKRVLQTQRHNGLYGLIACIIPTNRNRLLAVNYHKHLLRDRVIPWPGDSPVRIRPRAAVWVQGRHTPDEVLCELFALAEGSDVVSVGLPTKNYRLSALLRCGVGERRTYIADTLEGVPFHHCNQNIGMGLL